MDKLEKAVKGVHAALQGLEPAEAQRVARFVTAGEGTDTDDADSTPRVQMSVSDVVASWQKQEAGRAEAAAIQEHRRQRVLSEVEEMFGEGAVQNIVANIGGVEATAGTGGAKAKTSK